MFLCRIRKRLSAKFLILFTHSFTVPCLLLTNRLPDKVIVVVFIGLQFLTEGASHDPIYNCGIS